MDHNQAIREFERRMERQAEHAHTAATELAALVSILPNERPGSLHMAVLNGFAWTPDFTL
jgi:hypothetical protein